MRNRTYKGKVVKVKFKKCEEVVASSSFLTFSSYSGYTERAFTRSVLVSILGI